MPEGNNPKDDLNISKPGKSEQLISPSEALRRDSEFFEKRPPDNNWILKVRHLDGTVEEFPPGTDWEAVSRWGAVRSSVVTKPDGSPLYDRPRYDETPGVLVVAWGKDKKTGEIKVAMISQAHPHADNVFDTESDESMVFQQIPMGFLDKTIGKDQLEKFEPLEEGAKREAREEAGAAIVKNVSFPEYSNQYNSPSFSGTSSFLAFIEVDLDRVDNLKIDREEQIFKAEYISLSKLMDNIKKGKTENGYARLGISNSAVLIFLSHLDSFRNAERNEKILATEAEANKAFKKDNPAGYAKHRLRVANIKYPDRTKKNTEKVEQYLKNL